MRDVATIELFLVEKPFRETGKEVFAELRFGRRREVIGEVFATSPAGCLRKLAQALEAAGAAG
jgi:hypothetical protein